jgi:hypothetical protein
MKIVEGGGQTKQSNSWDRMQYAVCLIYDYTTSVSLIVFVPTGRVRPHGKPWICRLECQAILL